MSNEPVPAGQGVPVVNPAAVVGAAIAAANFPVNGMPYGPLMLHMQYIPGGAFWFSEKGDYPIGFYDAYQQFQFNGAAVRPLGDWALPMFGAPALLQVPRVITTFAMNPARPNIQALATPGDMQWVADDKGSGNPADIEYFRLMPPASGDYVPLGTSFLPFADIEPLPVNCYWCVDGRLLEPGIKTQFWDDRNQGWAHHSGNLTTMRLDPALKPIERMRIAPTCYLSTEAQQGYSTPSQYSTLVAGAPPLPVPGAGYPPPWSEQIAEETVILNVAALPNLNVAQDGNDNPTLFHYLSAESQWDWLGGATQATVGWAPSDPGLANRTGIKLGAVSGAVIPPSFNGMIAVDLSKMLGLPPVPGATAEAFTIELKPQAQFGSYWQRIVNLVLYDDQGMIVARDAVRTADVHYNPQP